MDAIATRGHVILDDAQVRLRTSGAAQRFTELFALKADSSTVSTGLGERPTASQVTSEIAAAINTLTGSAPALLNTLEEIANAINDDNDIYQTLLALWYERTEPRSYRKRNSHGQHKPCDAKHYWRIFDRFLLVPEHSDKRTCRETNHSRFGKQCRARDFVRKHS